MGTQFREKTLIITNHQHLKKSAFRHFQLLGFTLQLTVAYTRCRMPDAWYTKSTNFILASCSKLSHVSMLLCVSL